MGIVLQKLRKIKTKQSSEERHKKKTSRKTILQVSFPGKRQAKIIKLKYTFLLADKIDFYRFFIFFSFSPKFLILNSV